jgi:hypothetical protein
VDLLAVSHDVLISDVADVVAAHPIDVVGVVAGLVEVVARVDAVGAPAAVDLVVVTDGGLEVPMGCEACEGASEMAVVLCPEEAEALGLHSLGGTRRKRPEVLRNILKLARLRPVPGGGVIALGSWCLLFLPVP